MKRISLFLFVLVMHHALMSKILIMTHAYNRPEFIPLQDATFKKFVKNDYEFIVFNDARDPQLRKDIFDTCKNLGLQCIRIEQEVHDRPYLKRLPGEDYNSSCCRCANVVQYSLDEIGFKHDDIVVIVDSDLFLIKELDIREYMKDYVVSAVDQARGHVHYLWNCLVFLDVPQLPEKELFNFNCGKVDNISTDVGGHLYYYFKKYSHLPIKYITQWHLQEHSAEVTAKLVKKDLTRKTLSFLDDPIPDSIFMLDATFLHYQNGTNWNNNDPDYHKKKFKKLKKFIEHIIS